MGKLVDDFLTTPIPPEVWHYTNLSGFEGILSSGKLWATEAHYTTDATEFIHARQVAKAFLHNFKPSNRSIARAKQSALEVVENTFDQGALSSSKTEIYIASFCAIDNLESQWMKYADAGCGVSLSFDLRHVRPPSRLDSAVTFAPCLYETEEKEQMVQDALSTWIVTFADLHHKTGSAKWADEQLRSSKIVDRIFEVSFNKALLMDNNERNFRAQLHIALAHTYFDLLRIASHCKNYNFHQEAEWRLALPHIKGKPMKQMHVLHRGINNTIPYVAHNLFSNKLPLVRVKVGPMTDNIDQVRTLLTQYGYNIPISKSNISLRTAGSIKF